jgi:hypothetical protein
VHERRLVPDVIRGWNAAHSLALGAILEPVLWETHAIPALGDRPQGIINTQLVQHCDILIGTFWTRLGTSTGKAESGTAEEIEQFRASGKRVLLYFSSAPVVPKSLDQNQYGALMSYKEKLGSEGLYFEYEDIPQLQNLLQSHLAGVMSEMHSNGQASAFIQRTPQEDATQQFLSQYQNFVRRLEAEWASERDSDPFDIALGKLILSSALKQVLSFRSMIVAGLEGVTAVFTNCAKDMRALQRHEVYLDGGVSFDEFWSKGDAVIEVLKTVPQLIAEEISKDSNSEI